MGDAGATGCLAPRSTSFEYQRPCPRRAHALQVTDFLPLPPNSVFVRGDGLLRSDPAGYLRPRVEPSPQADILPFTCGSPLGISCPRMRDRRAGRRARAGTSR